MPQLQRAATADACGRVPDIALRPAYLWLRANAGSNAVVALPSSTTTFDYCLWTPTRGNHVEFATAATPADIAQLAAAFPMPDDSAAPPPARRCCASPCGHKGRGYPDRCSDGMIAL